MLRVMSPWVFRYIFRPHFLTLHNIRRHIYWVSTTLIGFILAKIIASFIVWITKRSDLPLWNRNQHQQTPTKLHHSDVFFLRGFFKLFLLLWKTCSQMLKNIYIGFSIKSKTFAIDTSHFLTKTHPALYPKL